MSRAAMHGCAAPCIRAHAAPAGRPPRPPAPSRRPTALMCCSDSPASDSHGRRQLLAGVPAAAAAFLLQAPARADDFTETPSGLRYLDIKVGEAGPLPKRGDTCVVHWAGYTKGYQGKRFGNTTVADEPYEFVLGAGEAIPAFEEAVGGMRPGGLRRVEVPGERPELSYARDRGQRFSSEIFRDRIFKYVRGPQPSDLFGQRALDFVLDNDTLQDFNRTLLFDIKLLSVRQH